MNNSIIRALAATALALMFGAAAADDAHHPSDPPKTQAGPVAPGPRAQMPQMDQHMKEMQAIHERMMKATSLEERQKAMEDARKAMQDGMGMMNQMMGPRGTMGRSGNTMSPSGASGGSNAQLQMMQKRMDMMQMMMQMMMDQQDGSHAGATAPTK